MSNSQELLFSEPSFAETGVWCELSEGIDPGEWASLCRYIGGLGARDFEVVRRKVVGSPDGLGSRVKRLFDISHSNAVKVPVLSIGPSGIGGEYQKEIKK